MSGESIVLAVITGAFAAVISPIVIAWINRRQRKVKDERDLWLLYQEVREEVGNLWDQLNHLYEENTTAWTHIEDVWRAITQEPDAGKAIEGRLRWPRPSRPTRPGKPERPKNRNIETEEE